MRIPVRSLTALALVLATGTLGFAQRKAVEAGGSNILRGRVLEQGTRKPVAEHPVQLFGGGTKTVVVRTDRDGRFEFELPAIDRRNLAVEAEHGQEFRAGRQISLAEYEEPLELELRRVVTRPLSGQVFDPKGTPLGNFVVQLREAGGPSELLTTDSAGNFVTTTYFAAGTMHAYPYENGVRSIPTQFTNDHERIEFCFPVGEFVEFDFTPPKGMSLEDFSVYTLEPDDHPGFEPGTEIELREGEYPWVRFSKNSWPSFDRDVHDLFLRSADGLWGARIPAPLPAGTRPVVRLEPLGAVSLRLTPDMRATVGSNGGRKQPRALSEVLWISLVKLAHDGSELRSYRGWALPGSDQRIDCLEPGRWRIDTPRACFEPRSGEVVALPGRCVPFVLPLGAPIASAPLVIRVAYAQADIPEWSGLSDAPSVSVTVGKGERQYSIVTSASCGVGIDAWFKRVARDGKYVLEVVLPDMPVVDHEVRLRTGGRRYEGPATVRPGVPAEYVLHEAVYGMRVTDAVTGDRIKEYRLVETAPRPKGLLTARPDADGVHARRPDGVGWNELRDWCVRVPGYRPAYLSWVDFDEGPQGSWADVELERGWGLGIRVSLIEEPFTAAGIVAIFDGRRFTVDERNMLMLSGPRPVSDPRVTFEDWEVAGGDIRADGRFDPTLDLLRVKLRPR